MEPADDGGWHKLQVLCLHGSRQSAGVFAKRLKTLERKCKAVADLHFIDAPHSVAEAEDESVSRCWWLPGLAKGEVHPDWPAQWSTSEQVLRAELEAASQRGRPYHGILGFSNGAACAAMLVSDSRGEAAPLRFAIFAGQQFDPFSSAG